MDDSQQQPEGGRLDEIIAEYLQALDRGQAPDRQALIDCNCEYTAELRDFFADRDEFERAVRPLRADKSASVSPSVALSPNAELLASATGSVVPYFGDYELLAEIGRGGMGVVYKARQVSLNRTVALKMILSGILAGERAVRRFRTEAESAANLDHANIVPIHEVGEYRGQHYFTMKLIQGGTLARQVHALGLDLRRCAQLMATVARAVHHAHQRGVLHRDIKPANILIDDNGTPYVTDFGLAKRVDDEMALTQTFALLGTPSYMAPEQAAGGELTTATDVYGLGATLYELLCGQPPFRADTAMATLQMAREKEPARLSCRNRRIDHDLETICLKCLEKERQRRYASAQAVADDLERWLRGEPIEARATTGWQRLKKLVRRHPAMSSMVAAVVALAIAIAAISTTAAIRLSDRSRRLAAAQADGRETLRGSYLIQAQARRFSGRAGRRFESLEAIRKAVEIRPGIDLRNEAIACMALADIRPMRSWQFTHNIAFDCDLERCAMRDGGGEDIFIKETATDRVISRLATKGFSPQEFSPDGAFLLVTDRNGGVQVWDLKQSSRIWPAPSSARGVTGDEQNDRWHVTWCRFTCTSSCLMYGGHDGLLHVYDLRTKQERTIPVSAQDAHINETGEKIAVRKGNDVGIYSAKDGSLLAVLPHKPGVLTWAWHPDGRRLATTSVPTPSDFAVHYWDVETQKELTGWTGHTGEVVGVAFDESGRFLLSTSWDKTTRIWDAETRKELVWIDGAGNDLRFSKNGDRLSFRQWGGEGFDLFEVATAPELRTLHGHHSGKGPYAASFHPKGRVLATISWDAVRVWDTERGSEIAVFSTFMDPVLFVFFSPDGRSLFANGWKRSINFGGSANDMELKIGAAEMLPRPRGVVYPIMGPHGYPSLIVNENGARVMRLDDPALQNGTRKIMQHSSLSPNGEWIAAEESAKVTIWDVRTSKPHRVVEGVGGRFSADGKWLMNFGPRDVRVLEVASGRSIPLFQRRDTGAWSADGHVLGVAQSMRAVQLVDTRTWTVIASLEPPNHNVFNEMEFSPDGSQLVVASEANLVDVWDLSLIRQQLRELGLDWDLPPLPLRERNPKPLRATITPQPG